LDLWRVEPKVVDKADGSVLTQVLLQVEKMDVLEVSQ
jgi:hypothetical protein